MAQLMQAQPADLAHLTPAWRRRERMSRSWDWSSQNAVKRLLVMLNDKDCLLGCRGADYIVLANAD